MAAWSGPRRSAPDEDERRRVAWLLRDDVDLAGGSAPVAPRMV